MADEQQQEGQKTLVAFIVGLLIGGMLVWAFSGSPEEMPVADGTQHAAVGDATDMSDDDHADVDMGESDDSGAVLEVVTKESNRPVEVAAPQLQVGEGKVVVKDQKAGLSVALDSATYPVSEGWIGVREYTNEQLGYILGVARFSEAQGLVPTEVTLLRETIPGKHYAIVIFTEDGDRSFSLANDVQIDTIFDTFTAK